jgi:thiamine pyrophosphate-dependent acetolactate synthase large subunit-like protein
MRVYEAVAQYFAAEGVDTQYGLMGDGNMHWMAAMDALPGMRTVTVRHEHCALMMAVGHWNVTGAPGVCSVTHGPGFTQLATGLATAARNHAGVVIVAGETGIGAPWAVQEMDHAPLARACGAAYLTVHSVKVLQHRVREAFYLARTENRPVVLGLPIDLQKAEAPDLPAYRPSTACLQPATPMAPDPDAVAIMAERLMSARAPMLVAGRGALAAGAGPAIEALADETGALLGTSLLGKGMFDWHPYSVGVVGGYISEAGRAAAEATDLVLAFGARLSRFTLDAGHLFGQAEIAQIDLAPQPLYEGLEVARHLMRADAKLAAEALLKAVRAKPHLRPAQIRSADLAERLRRAPADSDPFTPPAGRVDPRRLFEELEPLVQGYHLVSGAAHQAYWHTTMRTGPSGGYHAVRAFGAIGNSLSFASGVAVARGDGRVILSDGDGGLLMHIQELETLAREGVKLLILCLNDEAYGAEIHKLRADGLADTRAMFGATPLAEVARVFGLGAATVTDSTDLPALFAQFEADDRAWLWDVKVSDRQQSPPMRAGLARKGA